MKVLAILAAFVTVVVCQSSDDIIHDLDDTFHGMIHLEAQAIIKDDPDISVDDCAQKCDDLMNFLVDSSEQLGDELCEEACRCEITITDCEHEMPFPGLSMSTTVPPV